ncbi:class I SAM-dependent methyltransferase [Roseomonas sp. CCTCC AB2023176]|uniref:class I SAM-dependent methyltransferase n=1 Tax=Roseomonas sp. CCTCC AB2023176 TaxID=3342640 RepID=UPI0035D9E1E4
MTPAATKVMTALHGADVYAGFKPLLPLDLQGWNGRHPALLRAVAQVRPRIAFDVGTWKGESTVAMARAMREARPDCALVAVDTFLGSIQHWDLRREDRIADSLRRTHGWPALYWQFLSNVAHSGMQDVVVPLPQTSDNAAAILLREGIRADLIHLDAAHEDWPLRRDLNLYWDLLAPGGVLVGDDYPWPSVKAAADDFAAKLGLRPDVDGPKWTLRKPVRAGEAAVPPSPRMSAAELALFENVLRGVRGYVEFGAGGSTCFAASRIEGPLLSVDSSTDWLAKVSDACGANPDWVQPTLIHADIGPTREWGQPADPATRQRWPGYHGAPWANPASRQADLYLVDGRFRVACAVQVLLHCRPDAVIAFHDFASRREYHVILDVARELARAEELSLLVRRSDFDEAKARAILDKHAFSPG